jgi:hypothetical protein
MLWPFSTARKASPATAAGPRPGSHGLRLCGMVEEPRHQNISGVMTFCGRGPTSAERMVSAALSLVSS